LQQDKEKALDELASYLGSHNLLKHQQHPIHANRHRHLLAPQTPPASGTGAPSLPPSEATSARGR
jgi:hypothetical protein